MPGVKVVPPSSVGMRVTGSLPSASLYAITRSALATFATASARCTAPLTDTLACPVNAVPGDSPTSPPALPLIVVVPVLVIVEPAKTAKLEVVPRFTGGWAAILIVGTAIITTSNSVSSNGINRILLNVFINLFNPLYS
ncbi:MAG TPA: hypothetical protein VIK78_12425 [Ruminiclostridium sp.]